MRHFLAKIILLFSALCLGAHAAPPEKGTADEAVALVKRAVAYLQANGKDKAFAEFNKSGGQFATKDLYIFVYNTNGDGIMRAHGANAKLIGKQLWDMTDVDGKLFVRAFVDAANSPAGNGWVDYKWPNPVSKAIEAKRSYVEKSGDVLVGCGIYK